MTEIAPSIVDPEHRFRLRAPEVAFQVIEGEAILIHFERGAYYSARGTGCEILKLVESGRSVREIAEELAARSGVQLETVVTTVDDYIARLVSEGLIVLDATLERRAKADGNGRESFVFGEAELVKYTDLEDLLLLDPIHDVDDAGWPPHVGGSAAVPNG